eukprot:GFUD01113813.1.p1 GENE.GFUD01113813.1~~GFUD01113813.1.p1  ORF type:complete len:140 (+),score=23.67 GFUD01113813.1:52-471(+)
MDSIKKNISSYITTSSPGERVSVFGCCLGTFCVLIMFLNLFKGSTSRGLWTDRLCKLNIIVIGVSLLTTKYGIPLGCYPAIFISGLDVIVCSLYGLQALYSLILDSVKTIISAFISLLIAALALLYGQALLEIVPGSWK